MKNNFLLSMLCAMLACLATPQAHPAEFVVKRAFKVGAVFGAMITTAQAAHVFLQLKKEHARLSKEISKIKSLNNPDDRLHLAYLESQWQENETLLANPCAHICMKALQGAVMGCLGSIVFVKLLKEDKREENGNNWKDKAQTFMYQKAGLNQSDYDLAAAFGAVGATASATLFEDALTTHMVF